MSSQRPGSFITGRHVPALAPSAPASAAASILADATTALVGVELDANTPPESVSSFYYVLTDTVSGQQDVRVVSETPATVTGLSAIATYNDIKAFIGNSSGDSTPASRASVVPAGQEAYTTPGTYTFVAPANITSVSVVCVGGGGGPSSSAIGSGGGAGGGLGWKNDIPVTPGDSYTVVVGAGGAKVTSGVAPAGDASFFISDITVAGLGGGGSLGTGGGGTGGRFVGDGGGLGGNGGTQFTDTGGGGGGAGGYSGSGGSAGGSGSGVGGGVSGSGGGGGGGGRGGSADTGGSGGGVGLLGEGPSGLGGAASANDGAGGFGGSGGSDAAEASIDSLGNVYSNSNLNTPGLFGGGAGGSDGQAGDLAPSGGGGAVRIIFPAQVRRFPATNTGDF